VISAVLDASALLALLRDEPGAEVVRPILTDAAMTTVNWSEVIAHFARLGTEEANIRLVLTPLPIELVGVDEELAYITGLLLPVTRSAGLSLGDRACLALARRTGVPAMTADRNWSTVAAAAGVTVQLIR
jgi:ribonuclease VapC